MRQKPPLRPIKEGQVSGERGEGETRGTGKAEGEMQGKQKQGEAGSDHRLAGRHAAVMSNEKGQKPSLAEPQRHRERQKYSDG